MAGFCTIDIIEANSYQHTSYSYYSYPITLDTYGTTYSSGPSAANYTVTLLNAIYSPAPTLTLATSTTSTTTNPITPPISPNSASSSLSVRRLRIYRWRRARRIQRRREADAH